MVLRTNLLVAPADGNITRFTGLSKQIGIAEASAEAEYKDNRSMQPLRKLKLLHEKVAI